MAYVNVYKCDRCGATCDDPRRYTQHRHHDHRIDLCGLCDDAFHVWMSDKKSGISCYSEEYEKKIADELRPPEGFPHARNADGAIVVG